MPTGVYTTYYINGNSYASYILGDDISKIRQAIKRRNIGESVESQIQEIECIVDFTKLLLVDFNTHLPEITHLACYLSFIALKANTITIEEVLGDEGIVHQLSHLMSQEINEFSVRKIMADLQKLQKSAIGSYEPV